MKNKIELTWDDKPRGYSISFEQMDNFKAQSNKSIESGLTMAYGKGYDDGYKESVSMHRTWNDYRVIQLESDYEKLEGRYCRVIEECIEKDKQIALYKSREKYLLPKLNKVVEIMKSWKSNRIGRDYQTLKDIQEVII